MNQITTSTSRQPTSRAAALEAELQRRDPDEVVRIVAGMMLAFREGGSASRAVSAAYAAALSDLPVSAVAQAAERFARGQVPGRNHAFPPSSAELHVEAERIEGEIRREIRIFSPSPRPLALPEPEMDPGIRAQRAAVLDALSADMAARSAMDEAEERRRNAEAIARHKALGAEIAARLAARADHLPPEPGDAA